MVSRPLALLPLNLLIAFSSSVVVGGVCWRCLEVEYVACRNVLPVVCHVLFPMFIFRVLSCFLWDLVCRGQSSFSAFSCECARLVFSPQVPYSQELIFSFWDSSLVLAILFALFGVNLVEFQEEFVSSLFEGLLFQTIYGTSRGTCQNSVLLITRKYL